MAKIEKKCLNCGNIILVIPSLVDRKKYCSKSCANLGKRGVSNSPNTTFKKGQVPWNKKEPIDKICPRCGTKFQVKPSLDRITYCSQSCILKGTVPHNKGISPSNETKEKMRAAKLGIRGKDHWNWRDGGIARSERKLAMSRDEYKQWRLAVFTRDNFSCVMCKTTKNLEADHIKPWAIYINLRYDVNNGRTLCSECHKTTDTYGEKTKELMKHVVGHTRLGKPIFEVAGGSDNAEVTSGTGIPVATDQRNIDNSLVHVQRVGNLGASAVNTNQVQCDTVASIVIPARDTRNNVMIVNYGGVEVFIGGATVTTENGLKIPVGASFNIQTTADLYGITKVGETTIHYIEEYDV